MATDDGTDVLYTSKSEYITQHVVGCGPFQVLVFLAVFVLGFLGNVFSQMLMAFGNYNPGWRCLDSNVTTNVPENSTSKYSHDSITILDTNGQLLITNSSAEYITGNCTLFDSCQHIEFRPGTSTIVTEWGLVCGKAWIASLIISLQYAGMAFGVTFVGYLGDAIGRKMTIYTTLAMTCVISVISIFATSWEMFAVMQFFIGLSLSGFVILVFVYMAEFVTRKWRNPVSNVPSFTIMTIVFAVVCMLLKDWRHIRIVGAVVVGICIVPVFWLPESLRWLEVKNKTSKFEKVIKKMSKLNGEVLPAMDHIESKINCSREGEKVVENSKEVSKGSEDLPISDTSGSVNSTHKSETSKNEGMNENTSVLQDKARSSIFDLFKPACIKYTLLLILPNFTMSLIFNALGFGVKALSGDFYINLLIMNAFDILFSPIFMILPNVIGRKPSGIAFSGISGVCLLTAAFFHKLASDYAKTTGVLIMAIVARSTIGGFWGLMLTYTVELYPTVVRGLGTSWTNFILRLGGVAAPYLIPNDPDSFFICYIIMAGLAILCSGIIMLLPETKGRQLKETLEVE